MRLIDFLDRGALLGGDSECLVDRELRLRYPQVVALTHRIARALARDGIHAGDRVAILGPNCALGLVCLFGLLRADAVLVPLNVRNSLADNLHHARSAGARLLFFHSSVLQDAESLADGVEGLDTLVSIDGPAAGHPDLLQWLGGVASAPVVPPQPPDPETVWRLSMTGGTTGTPKLVMQPHRAAEATMATLLALLRYESRPTYLLAAPMTHAAGVFAFGYLAMGGRVVVLARAEPAAVLAAIEEHRANALFLPPTALYMMLADPGVRGTDHSSLRHFLFGAAPVSRDKLAEAIDTFGPVMTQLYGQTEASSVLTCMSPQDYEHARADPGLAARMSSCGRATPFVTLAVMDPDGRLLPPDEPGELVVRSSLVMRGYLGAPDETAAASAHGWHHTGDVGRIDANGFVTIVDRKRDLIISGGFNVFPTEVEQVLWAHPAVQDCAVVGVPDEKWGEAVKAVVELKPGSRATPEDLAAWCRARLGGVKTPKSVEIWSALPRSAVGKVLRREVRQTFWVDRDRRI